MKSSTALLLSSLYAVSLWGWGGGQELAWSSTIEPPVKDQSCGQSPQHMRVSARYTSPKGVGYNEGYTTLETFLSPWDVFNDKWLPFVDGRGHIFDNGKWAANAGLGVRYMSSSRVWGINSYYDYRNTYRRNYNQVSVGLETLGTFWDLRINGYLPVGKTHTSLYNTRFKGFKENSMLVSSKRQFAMKGINAEAGFHVDHFRKAPLYFAAGPYYLSGKGASTWGGEFRARVDLFKHYVRLEGNTAYDHFFKWTGQGQISINIPFGGKDKVKKRGDSCSQSMRLSERIVQPVDRSEIIPVGKHRVTGPAINPATGKPFFFIFVNNTSHSLGTYESPYPTLLEAQNASNPNDIIYIFPGDQTTTGMNSGIILKDGQRLWGSAAPHSILTTQGAISIPAKSGGLVGQTVVMPILSNSTGNVVTLANNNEISGLFLENTGSSYAIYGTDVSNATVSNCTMAGANAQGYTGFSTTELSGILTIQNCTFNQNYGVYLSNSTTNLQVNISDSSFSGGTGTTSSITWELGSQGTLNVQNSNIKSYYTGIEVDLLGTSVLTANINNNTISAGGYGIYMNGSSATSAAQNISINKNTVTSYYQSIILAQNGELNATLVGNSINSSYYCLEVETLAGNGSVVANANTMIASDDYAVYFNQTGGNLTVSFDNNTINSIDDYALYNFMSGAANSLTLTMTNNEIAGDYGWYLDQTAGNATTTWANNTVVAEYGWYIDQSAGILNATFNDNVCRTTTDEESIYWDISGGAIATNISFTNNQLSSYYPIWGVQSAGDLNLSIDNNILSGETAVYLQLSNPATNLTMNGNTCYGYTPVYITHTGGTLDSTLTSNVINAGGSNALTYSASGAASSNQTMTGNTIIAGGYAGNAIILDLSSTGAVNASITNNTLSASASGAVVSFLNSGTQLLELSNNTVTNSGGYTLNAAGGSTATWIVSDNQFTASNTTPVSATTSGAGIACMTLNNNTAYPTANAYVLNNTGSGPFTLNPPQGNIGTLTQTGVTVGTCP